MVRSERHFRGRLRMATRATSTPMLRLDRIYCRPRSAFVKCFTDRSGRGYSDHLPVIADVTPAR